MSKKTPEATPPVEVDDDDDEDEDDPLDAAIRKTGCIELHHELQECMADNKDWRQCQSKVVAFRKCMSDYHTKQQTAYGNKVS
ncbi:hypothetical protein LSAT2_016090 [Lamellibrachia satsuma]|nr:hypothetical protein LSAT2_016090 [Lamellibrachia satsuma]